MAENKTKATEASVEEFLASVDEKRQEDCRAIAAMMEEIVGVKPKMWGKSMVGYGSYHYVCKSGCEGDAMLTGFAPQSKNLALFIMAGFDGQEKLMSRLGKHKTGKACLYINKFADVDQAVLRELIARSVTTMQQRYESTP